MLQVSLDFFVCDFPKPQKTHSGWLKYWMQARNSEFAQLPFLQLFCKTCKFRCAFPVYSTRLLCAFIRKLWEWFVVEKQRPGLLQISESSQEGGAAVKLPDLCFNLQRSTRPRDPRFLQNNHQKKKKRNMGCLSHDCFFLPSNIKTCVV